MKHFNAWLGRNLIPKTPVALLEKNTFSDEGVGSENSIEQPPKPTTKLMVGTRILDEGQVIPMQEEPVVQLTRGELYCEIWELSVAGLSRKLAIPYLGVAEQTDISNTKPRFGWKTANLKNGQEECGACAPSSAPTVAWQ